MFVLVMFYVDFCASVKAFNFEIMEDSTIYFMSNCIKPV